MAEPKTKAQADTGDSWFVQTVPRSYVDKTGTFPPFWVVLPKACAWQGKVIHWGCFALLLSIFFSDYAPGRESLPLFLVLTFFGLNILYRFKATRTPAS